MHRPRTRAALVAALLAVGAPLLAACSSDDAKDTTAVETSVDTQAADTEAADTEAADTEAADTEAADDGADTEAIDTDVDGTEAADAGATIQTAGIYDCGADEPGSAVNIFWRFTDDGRYYATYAEATIDDVRTWLGVDDTKVAPGAYTVDGAAFQADTDPGDAPGVLVEGTIGADGATLEAHSVSELNSNERDLSCTFVAD